MRVLAGIVLLLSMSAGAGAERALSRGAAVFGASTAASTPNALIVAQAPSKAKPRRRLSAEQSFNVTKFINTCDAYVEFLRSYPGSRYAATARKWMQQKCRAKLVRDVPPAPASETASQGSAGVQSAPETVPATVPPKVQPQRQKSRGQRKTTPRKRVARPKPAAQRAPVVRKKRSTVRRCRRETTLDCIKRGGEFQFGQCDRQRVCD